MIIYAFIIKIALPVVFNIQFEESRGYFCLYGRIFAFKTKIGNFLHFCVIFSPSNQHSLIV